MNSILVIDQESIYQSFGAKTLFLNYKPIAEETDDFVIDVDDIAAGISNTGSYEKGNHKLEFFTMTPIILASYIASKEGVQLSEDTDSEELDDYISGYSNDDLIRAYMHHNPIEIAAKENGFFVGGRLIESHMELDFKYHLCTVRQMNV